MRKFAGLGALREDRPPAMHLKTRAPIAAEHLEYCIRYWETEFEKIQLVDVLAKKP